MFCFHKEKIKKLLILFLIVSSFILIGATKKANIVAIIKVNNLNFRAAPLLNSHIILRLQQNDELLILSEEDGWIKALYKGEIGYFKKEARFFEEKKIQSKKDVKEENIKKKIKKNIVQKSQIKKSLNKNKSSLKKYKKEEEEVILEIEKIKKNLSLMQKELKNIRKNIKKIDLKIDDINKQLKNIEEKIKSNIDYMQMHLLILYKLKKTQDNFSFFLSPNYFYDLFKKKTAVEKILEFDSLILKEITQKKEKLLCLEEELRIQKKRKIQLQKDAKIKIKKIVNTKWEKRILLKKVQKNKKYVEARLKYLQTARKKLDLKIAQLQIQMKKMNNKDAYLYNEIMKKKGKLSMPVKGNIISRFGQKLDKKLNVKTFQNGIKIKARVGNGVKCVLEGKVSYAGWFEGYGNIMIIDNGGNFYTLYAYLDDLNKKNGDYVKEGEKIGKVSNYASPSCLYFELVHKLKPVNPAFWFKKK